MQVLVSHHQLSDRLRREQHFSRVERAALVDLGEPPLQHHSLHRRFTLRILQIRRRRLHFVGDGDHLLVQRLHHPGGRVVLLVEEVHLVAQLVGRVLEAVHLRLELVALGTNARQLVALRVDARLRVLRLLREKRGSQEQRAHRHAIRRPTQIRRKCLPTETRLPSTPMIAPPTTPKKISSRSKKIVSMKYSLTTLLAIQTNKSASSPPSTPFTRPSIRNGRRMNMSVAPTRRMIEISFARASTVMRMVAPMMMTATAAKAMPSAIPATVAMLRRR